MRTKDDVAGGVHGIGHVARGAQDVRLMRRADLRHKLHGRIGGAAGGHVVDDNNIELVLCAQGMHSGRDVGGRDGAARAHALVVAPA